MNYWHLAFDTWYRCGMWGLVRRGSRVRADKSAPTPGRKNGKLRRQSLPYH